MLLPANYFRGVSSESCIVCSINVNLITSQNNSFIYIVANCQCKFLFSKMAALVSFPFYIHHSNKEIRYWPTTLLSCFSISSFILLPKCSIFAARQVEHDRSMISLIFSSIYIAISRSLFHLRLQFIPGNRKISVEKYLAHLLAFTNLKFLVFYVEKCKQLSNICTLRN